MKVIKPIDLNTDGGFTRASSGKYYDVNKVYQSAAIDEPRFQFNPTTGSFEGLLLEAAGENILLYSEEFDNPVWFKFNVTVSANSTNAPTGTAIADKIVENTEGGTHFIRYSAGDVADTTVTGSVFLKASERTFACVLFGTETNNAEVYLDLSAGTITSTISYGTATVVPEIQDVGLGWYRVIIPVENDLDSGGGTLLTVRLMQDSSTTSYTGDGFSGLFCYGAQIEAGTVTSYMQSTGTAGTRAADVVTGTGLIWTDLVNIHADYNAGTTYSLSDKVSYAGRYYESLQNSNTGNQPDISATFWLDTGPDNKHATLDTSISTTSSKLEEFTLVLKPGALYDSIALIEMSASVVRVGVTDAAGGVVFSQTYGLSGDTVYDWYQYFFYDPTVKRTQLVDLTIPPYAESVITITLQTSASEIASVGQIIIGNYSELGLARWGANSGIVDYSVKETDDFGNTSFVQRAFSKRVNASVYVANSELNRVQKLLYSLRATPSVWIVSDDPTFEETLIVYGFYRDFNTEIAYPRHSIYNIEIEGLA